MPPLVMIVTWPMVPNSAVLFDGIDADFLKRLDVVGERSDLRFRNTVAHRGSVEAPVRLIRAAAGESNRGTGGGLQNIWHQRQLGPNGARVQRHIAQLSDVAGVGDASGFGFDQRCAACYLHNRIDRADLQDDVDAPIVAADKVDVLDHELFEAGLVGSYSVGAFAELGDRKHTVIVGSSSRLDAGGHVRGNYGDLGHYGSG